MQWAELSQLRLDGHNPRLKEGMENASQAELLAELAREYELQDLGRSIADNGYFSEEPLVAIRNKGGKTWTIVEGNRRLAALQLLEIRMPRPRSCAGNGRNWRRAGRNSSNRFPSLNTRSGTKSHRTSAFATSQG